MDTPQPFVATTDPVLRLTRAEMAALEQTHRQRRLAPLWGIAIFLAGVGVTGTLFAMGLPERWWPVALLSGVVTIGLALRVAARLEARRLAPYRLDCPACGATLLPPATPHGSGQHLAMTLMTGRCPHCGDVIAD